MAYIPNAADPTQPADTVAVSTAASEFRALKLYLSQRITALTNAIAAALVNTNLTGVPTAPTAAAGTNTTQVATTAHTHSVTDVVYSPNVTPLPAPGTLLSWTHGLGLVPADVVLELVCLTADLGYAAGDVVVPTMSTVSYGFPATPAKNATAVFCRTAVGAAYSFDVINNTTGALTQISALASWAVRFKVRKY